MIYNKQWLKLHGIDYNNLKKRFDGDNGQTNANDSDIASTESEVNIETEEESKPTNGGTSSEENR